MFRGSRRHVHTVTCRCFHDAAIFAHHACCCLLMLAGAARLMPSLFPPMRGRPYAAARICRACVIARFARHHVMRHESAFYAHMLFDIECKDAHARPRADAKEPPRQCAACACAGLFIIIAHYATLPPADSMPLPRPDRQNFSPPPLRHHLLIVCYRYLPTDHCCLLHLMATDL